MMTAISLTMTEKSLLRKAANNTRGYVSATTAGGRGVRSVRMIDRLFNRGLLSDREAVAERDTHAGRSVYFLTVTARITEAGRKALRA